MLPDNVDENTLLSSKVTDADEKGDELVLLPSGVDVVDDNEVVDVKLLSDDDDDDIDEVVLPSDVDDDEDKLSLADVDDIDADKDELALSDSIDDDAGAVEYTEDEIVVEAVSSNAVALLPYDDVSSEEESEAIEPSSAGGDDE
ncbi:hypothetical protein G7054_g8939 [Neopestalotiopsis clavispora]|nr:hypothetical protein G7054_g8939 [Neopestalotiopsis clavispora]